MNMKKERKLTDAEIRRLEAFRQREKQMEEQGYKETVLTIDMTKANVFALVLIIPLFLIGFGLQYIMHKSLCLSFQASDSLLFFGGILILTAVHELIHGVTWAAYAKNHFRDIEFGFMVNAMAPYCTCSAPMQKQPYITGALMPLIILGIIPSIIGILIGSGLLLAAGLFMIDGAAGDILIVNQLLKHKASSSDVLYLDHPTEAGLVVFER